MAVASKVRTIGWPAWVSAFFCRPVEAIHSTWEPWCLSASWMKWNMPQRPSYGGNSLGVPSLNLRATLVPEALPGHEYVWPAEAEAENSWVSPSMVNLMLSWSADGVG